MWKLESTSLSGKRSYQPTVLRKCLTTENNYLKFVLGLLNILLKYLRNNSLEQYLNYDIILFLQIDLKSIFACFAIILPEYFKKGKEGRISVLLIVKMPHYSLKLED